MENMAVKSKMVKRKGPTTAEFSADKIDTTAPANKILEDISERNSQALNFYIQTIRQLSRKSTGEHHLVPGHPLSAFPDDWDGGVNSGFFEQFTYKTFTPKIITPLRNTEKKDPIAALLQQKINWKTKCDVLCPNHTTARNILSTRCEVLNEDVMFCPKALVDIAAHLDSEPEPYISTKSSYNWLYAGNGNLQLVCVNWATYLLYSEFFTLYLTQFSKNDLSLNSEPAATFDCGANILEIICSIQHMVAVRTKNKVFILKISSEEKIEIEMVQALESELPFTGISFDGHHKNILYVTKLDNKLVIVNLDRLKIRTVQLKSKFSSIVNNWQTVVGTERPYYTHVARNCITTYDKRTNKPNLVWNNLNRVTNEKKCDEITAVRQCERTSYMYIGTDHHIFLIDLRCSNSKIKPVQRWIHGMASPPTYISLCSFECNKDIICLSSQWCPDTCLLPNYNCSQVKEFRGVSMPYRPPSILDTLNRAREKSLCLDLYKPYEKRLCTAVSGNLIFEQIENYAILTLNSLGDITSHTLFPDHTESFLEDDSVAKLDEWCKNLQFKRKKYVVSQIADFSNVWKNLKKVPKDYRVGEGKVCEEPVSNFNEEEIEEIFEKEGLDAGLLEAWKNESEETTMEATQNSTTSGVLNLRYDTDSE